MEEKISRKSFIRLGTLLGVGAASASALAACGGGGSGSGASGSGGGYGNGGSDAGGGGQKDKENAGGNGGRPKEQEAAQKPAKEGAADPKPAKGKAIARASEVRSGSAVKFEDGGQPAVLVHLESGDFVAYSAVCTHAGCEVGYTNKQLACPCHGSVFDPANGGEVVSPPADRPLPEIPVRVTGGEVFRA